MGGCALLSRSVLSSFLLPPTPSLFVSVFSAHALQKELNPSTTTGVAGLKGASRAGSELGVQLGG